MKCEELRQEFMEVMLAGPEAISPEAREHLKHCAACSRELASYQATMALLDEWEAPEASPYFQTRLRARLREEAYAAPRSWLAWIRRPVVAAAAVVLLAVGAGLLELGHFGGDHNTLANNDTAIHANAPGSAVGDLQYLDKNADLFSDFDALDGQSSAESE